MKYIINHSLNDFKVLDINSINDVKPDDTVVMVLDETTNGKIKEYYTATEKMLLDRVNLYCVSIIDASNISKSIMSLMATYQNYNIYTTYTKELINSDYVENILKRTPDILEVQQYIGGDVSAYSEMNTILLGIKSLVEYGDVDGIKSFIEKHLESIDSSVEVFNYLRQIASTYNNGKVLEAISQIKETIDKYQDEISDLKSSVKQYKKDNDKLTESNTRLKSDNEKANSELADLKERVKNNVGTSAITSYSTLNTAIGMKCRTKYILYFKEISYPLYMNTYINNLLAQLSILFNKKVKLIIFDDKVGITGVYSRIPMYNIKEYISVKDTPQFDNAQKIVVTDANTVVLQDVITSGFTHGNEYEVVIVYDRLKQKNDIIVGNNVTKILVTNSEGNLRDNEAQLSGNWRLIFSGNADIKNSLTISKIDDYKSLSDSAASKKYMNMKGTIDGETYTLNKWVMYKANIIKKGE
ncbi:MAG: hypothetical protein IJ593_01265 [Lachnospiraceae bacterium]|nr:hypothetical protein [Lachnospiraceae bacterium]